MSEPRHALQTLSQGESVIVVGAGEQAEIAHEYLTHDSPHTVVAFAVESEFKSGDSFMGLPLVTLDEMAVRFPPERHRALVAVSATQLNTVRARLYRAVKGLGYSCVSYVSSRAFVWPNVEIGENAFVFEHVVLQHHVAIGDNSILWSGACLAHRTRLGRDAFVGPRATVAGFCNVGQGVFLGVNCTVADNLTLGDECAVGAGAVVVADTEPRQVYVGNPARPTGRDSHDTFQVPDDLPLR